MSEKFIVTTYDRTELISMIREALKEELKEYLDHLENREVMITFFFHDKK